DVADERPTVDVADERPEIDVAGERPMVDVADERPMVDVAGERPETNVGIPQGKEQQQQQWQLQDSHSKPPDGFRGVSLYYPPCRDNEPIFYEAEIARHPTQVL